MDVSPLDCISKSGVTRKQKFDPSHNWDPKILDPTRFKSDWTCFRAKV
jgi:hypothetical protein